MFKQGSLEPDTTASQLDEKNTLIRLPDLTVLIVVDFGPVRPLTEG